MQFDAKEHRFTNCEGSNFLGHLIIGGTDFHVTAIQVETDEDGNQSAVDDPYDRLHALYDFDEDGYFETVKIRGIEGDFVVVVYPFMR
jgi:hypothetical protein